MSNKFSLPVTWVIYREQGENMHMEIRGVKYQETLSALECTFQAGEMNSNFMFIIIMMMMI